MFKLFLVSCFCVSLFFINGIINGTDYRINLTKSMPYGIYKITPLERGFKLQTGDLVSVCLDKKFSDLALEREYLKSGECLHGTQALLKEVTAVANDSFELTAEGFVINGKLLANSSPKLRDSKDRIMPHADSLNSKIIDEGFALVLATSSPSSFDSRYFGLMPTIFMTKVQPILTF